ncbi:MULTISPECIES: hypothetical protein [Streptomyces]|uniref:Uncharacterized protein n=1 Tax=Streptomyces chilikensis TaxID=1194079 RepID=A0ABV3ESB7_9ACTN|nr:MULTISPECIES: hypothetical protein [Streptomyces]MDH6223258.1 hypothetical protein [Streptomyces sp. MJP52]
MTVTGTNGEVTAVAAGAAGSAPLAPVPWERVRRFRLGTEERPAPGWRGRPVRGPLALRVRQGRGRGSLFPPCAFVRVPAVPDAAGRPTAGAVCADPGLTRPICSLDLPVRTGREHRWTVRDARGREIGTIRRVPGRFLLYPRSWRFEQPGRPVVTARTEWLTANPLRLLWRLLGGFWGVVLVVLSFALGEGEADLDDEGPRVLVWRTGFRTVATSRGSWKFRVRADWLDRRLLFAFAVIGDR